jgi:hypothetical protein
MDAKETAVYFIAGDDYFVYESGERKHINKIYRLKEKYPDDVTILDENRGRYVRARMPVSVFRFAVNAKHKGAKRTDEQIKQAAKNLEAYKEQQRAKRVEANTGI